MVASRGRLDWRTRTLSVPLLFAWQASFIPLGVPSATCRIRPARVPHDGGKGRLTENLACATLARVVRRGVMAGLQEELMALEG